jgi:AraC family transcriptional regulator
MQDAEESSGRVVKQALIAGFELAETFYPAKYQTPRHSHDYTYFCFILQGAYTLRYRGLGHLCQPAQLLFFPQDTDHACRVHTHSRCFNFHLDSQLAEYTKSRKHSSEDMVIQRRPELIKLCLRLRKEAQSPDEFSQLSVSGLIAEITAEFFRHSERYSGRLAPRWLLAARDLISDEFRNSLTLSSIADLVGVHPAHLAREFKRCFQTTIGDFVRNRRVEFVCRRLTQSDAPLSELAAEAGFFDQSHLTRVLKRATGMTPAAYRASFRQC